jgi:hypothetical protein
MTCQASLEKFQNLVDVLEHCGGTIGQVPGLTNMMLEANGIDPDLASREQVAEAMKAAQEQYLSVAFLLGSDRNRYGKLMEDLENDYIQRQDRYPKTGTTAYSLLMNWKEDTRNIMRIMGPTKNGISFKYVGGNEESEPALNTNGRRAQRPNNKDKSHITCH